MNHDYAHADARNALTLGGQLLALEAAIILQRRIRAEQAARRLRPNSKVGYGVRILGPVISRVMPDNPISVSEIYALARPHCPGLSLSSTEKTLYKMRDMGLLIHTKKPPKPNAPPIKHYRIVDRMPAYGDDA